jgi:hypothetical protein
MQPGNIEPEMLDAVMAGQYMGIVRETRPDPDPARTLRNQLQKVYWLVRTGKIPPEAYRKIGSRIYFIKAQLDRWMRSGAHQP